MGAVVVILLMKEREMVDAFRRAGATSPESARSIDAVGVEDGSSGLRRLRDRSIIREGSPGKFYLDIPVWESFQRTRQRMMVVILTLVLVAIAFGILAIRP